MSTAQKSTTSPNRLEVVVVGAGQAGLATSYFLKRHGIEHQVLERGRVGESWRSQRWDSFAVNTPNILNALPGAPYDGSAPDGFHTRDELVASFTNYLERFDLPVRTGVAVDGVEAASGWDEFNVLTCGADGLRRTIRARSVVVASGMLNKPKLPSFADSLPAELVQMHAADYRNPRTLPPGAAMVVGSARSACAAPGGLAAASRDARLPRNSSRPGDAYSCAPVEWGASHAVTEAGTSSSGSGIAESCTCGERNSMIRPSWRRRSRRFPVSADSVIPSVCSNWLWPGSRCSGASPTFGGPASYSTTA